MEKVKIFLYKKYILFICAGIAFLSFIWQNNFFDFFESEFYRAKGILTLLLVILCILVPKKEKILPLLSVPLTMRLLLTAYDWFESIFVDGYTFMVEYLAHLWWNAIFAIAFVLFLFGVIKSKVPIIACGTITGIVYIYDYIRWNENLNFDFSRSFTFVLFLLAYIGISFSIKVKTESGEMINESAPHEQRNVAKCIILSVITCGIYGIVWLYQMILDIQNLNDEKDSGIAELLLNIFVPFYSIYWFYTRGKKLYNAGTRKGYALEDRSTLYLILSIVGLGIINYVLIQTDLNTMVSTVPSEQGRTILAAPQKADDNIETLKKLSELKEQGILSEEEFEAKKQELLGRL